MNNKWLKLSLVAVVGVIAVVAASPKTEAGATPGKRTICHRGQTLEVAEAAVQAHLGHGDTVGPCVITPAQNQ